MFSIFPAKDSEGTIDAKITGVQARTYILAALYLRIYYFYCIYVFIIHTQVELVVVLDTKKTFDEQAQSQIGIKHFNVRKSLAKSFL